MTFKIPKKFKVIDRPWTIATDADRYRYLVEQLVWLDEICQVFVEDSWLVATSETGQRVIPVWPSEGTARVCLGDLAKDCSFKVLTKAEFEQDFLEKLYEDELVAVFPNENQSYQMRDANEIMAAIEFSQLVKSGFDGQLTQEDAERLKRYVGLFQN